MANWRAIALLLRPHAFTENLSFEMREYREQPGHRTTHRRGQVERFSEGHEPDSQFVEFLERHHLVRHRSSPAI